MAFPVKETHRSGLYIYVCEWYYHYISSIHEIAYYKRKQQRILRPEFFSAPISSPHQKHPLQNVYSSELTLVLLWQHGLSALGMGTCSESWHTALKVTKPIMRIVDLLFCHSVCGHWYLEAGTNGLRWTSLILKPWKVKWMRMDRGSFSLTAAGLMINSLRPFSVERRSHLLRLHLK